MVGQRVNAADSYREALRLQPDDRTALMNLDRLEAMGEVA